MLRWMDAESGDAVVDVVLSLDRYVKRTYANEIATASYSHVQPTMDALDQIVDKIEALKTETTKLDGHAQAYMRAMLKGFHTFARSLAGDNISYLSLIGDIQELPFAPIGDEKALKLKEAVDQQLRDSGYTGSFADKLAAWRTATEIPSDQVVSVADKFLARSKKATLERVIELPAEDGIDSVNSIRGVFWSGYSRYLGNFRGKLTFNIDRPWYEPVFAQILNHEGYPGHQAFYCRWDYLYLQGKLPIEASYYLINSPTNALFEGGPETALHFLGWDDLNEDTPLVTDQEKKVFRLARDYLDFQRIFMTNACYYVNTGQMNQTQAINYMENEGHLSAVEAHNVYRFLTDPIQKTYYPVYYYGRWMIGRSFDFIPKEKRGEYFKILYDTPQTTSTFIDSVSKLAGRPFDPFDETKWQ